MPTIDELLSQTQRSLRAGEQALVKELQTEQGRRRGPLNRQLHELRRMMLAGQYPFYSQAGQDRAVDQFLRQKRAGTFVDVGGYDGVTGSNTLFFEHWREWTGVLVEPVPSNLARAQQVRRCPCLALAVAASDGAADFIEVTEGYTQMSGLASSYDEGLLKTVRDDPRHKEVTLKVETRTLSRILIDAGLDHPDFVSLDIEGGEVDTLSAFDFGMHDVKIWAIENNTATPEIGEIMRDNGYVLSEFCGPDEIWRKRDL